MSRERGSIESKEDGIGNEEQIDHKWEQSKRLALMAKHTFIASPYDPRHLSLLQLSGTLPT